MFEHGGQLHRGKQNLEIEFLRSKDQKEAADDLLAKSKTLGEVFASGLLRRKQLREDGKAGSL